MKVPKPFKRIIISLLVEWRKFRKHFRNRFQDVEVELYDLNKVVEPYFRYFNIVLVLLAVASLVASEGFELSSPFNTWNAYLEFSIVLGFTSTYFGRLLLTSKRSQLIRNRLFESLLVGFLILFGVLYLIGGEGFIFSIEELFGIYKLIPMLILLTKVYLILLLIIKGVRAAPIILSLKRKPTQVVALSFLSVIAAGAFFLMLPSATVDGEGLRFIDALFTSTSAVCVTGLIVVDTATHLTFFGQLVVLILIQIGGLGLLTIATLFALFVSSNLGLGQMMLLKGTIGETRTHETFQTIKRIVLLTLFIEGMGALGYYLSWADIFETNGERIFFSVFHAVSAFCNAGFSVFTNSLADKVNALNYGINITTMLLIVTGGLGFTTLWEVLKGNPSRKVKHWKLSLHAKLVLYSTGVLIVGGTIAILVLEWEGVLAGYSVSDKLLLSAFQSVTTRTAGFNTVDIGALGESTTLIFLTLMIIGGAPASTAGGMKTTTISVLLISVWSIITGKRNVEFSKRKIARSTLNTAITVFVLVAILLFIFTLILTITEDQPFMDLLFEEFSAFATVGLSRGITSSLTDAGKVVIISSMFIGRVGIVTLALAFAKRKTATKYSYPSESVIVA
ncbi:TrkH family potassium uptake protein [Gracilimonas tropica]|uniref:TrkH family potassium uptake protein n=1 Tax=Gracilimonas tropica TaxID=454600 RepID=UPI00037DA3DC|nr:potassium transporter TrkG [Gracilimonas tropica]